MNQTVSTALVIYAVGCVVPTPLEQQEQAINYPPALVSSQVTPPLGPLSLTDLDFVELNLAVDDPNLEDNLYARLFQLGSSPGSRVYRAIETKLDSRDAMLPNRRYGAFPPISICTALGEGEYYVVIADRPFSNVPNQQNQAPGGLTDENHWSLECL